MSTQSYFELRDQFRAVQEQLEAAKQDKLRQLHREKDTLLTRLTSLDAEIAAVSADELNFSVTEAAASSKSAAAGTVAGVSIDANADFRDILLSVLKQTGRALTHRQMTDSLIAAGYPHVDAAKLRKKVESKMLNLKKQGLIEPSPTGSGFVLRGKSATTGKSATAKGTSEPQAAKKVDKGHARNGKATKPNTSKAKQPILKGEQRPLREVILQVLRSSKNPLTGSQLAKAILATGYQTEAKDFPNVVKGALHKIPNVVNVRGAGYKLTN